MRAATIMHGGGAGSQPIPSIKESSMLTIEKITTTTPATDAEAQPLTTQEANVLLMQSAGGEKQLRVPGAQGEPRAWVRRGQVD